MFYNSSPSQCQFLMNLLNLIINPFFFFSFFLPGYTGDLPELNQILFSALHISFMEYIT